MSRSLPRGAYLALMFVMNVLLGTAYSWSVFIKPLREAYGMTPFEAMLPFAIVLATFALAMPIAGRLLNRLGPRWVAVIGGLFVSGGYMLSAVVGVTPWPAPTLAITYGVVVGIGLGFAYNPPIPMAVRWFPDRKGLATGFVVMGVGLSPLFTAPLANVLIGAYDIPGTFLILGILFLVTLIPLAWTFRFPPPDYAPPAPPPGAAAKRTWSPVGDVETAAMLRTSSFWLAWFLYTIGTAGGFMIIGNAAKIADEVGRMDPFWQIVAVQVLAVFNSIGRPGFGRVVDSLGPRRTLLVMFGLMSAAMALLSASLGSIALFTGIAVTAIAFGGFLSVMPALSTWFFGTKNLGTNYGALFTGFGAGAVVALFAAGWIRTAYGDYVYTFYAGVILSLIGLAVSTIVRPPRTAAAA